jgi:hypothetical protein
MTARRAHRAIGRATFVEGQAETGRPGLVIGSVAVIVDAFHDVYAIASSRLRPHSFGASGSYGRVNRAYHALAAFGYGTA